jgi:hypothetical protein
MAKRKRNPAAAADTSSNKGPSADERIARLLGLLLVRDIKSAIDQVGLLRRAGFTVSDVAQMLNMTENHVRVADHAGRKKKAS